jgi:hypothetical protein
MHIRSGGDSGRIRLVWRDGGEEAADSRPQLILRARCGLAQQRLELGKELLDRVEVGRIRRQVQERGPGRRERLSDAGAERRVVFRAMCGLTFSARIRATKPAASYPLSAAKLARCRPL